VDNQILIIIIIIIIMSYKWRQKYHFG